MLAFHLIMKYNGVDDVHCLSKRRSAIYVIYKLNSDYNYLFLFVHILPKSRSLTLLKENNSRFLSKETEHKLCIIYKKLFKLRGKQ